jgi:hypothetical protein
MASKIKPDMKASVMAAVMYSGVPTEATWLAAAAVLIRTAFF